MSIPVLPASDTGVVNALDPRGMRNIERLAKSNDPKALKAAAQQFEAVFLQMVLKSMRDATPKEGLFDNDQSRMYESFLDQQLSQVMASKRGVGLAQVIERQLQRIAVSSEQGDLPESFPLTPPAKSYPLPGAGAASAVPQRLTFPEPANSGEPRDFVSRLWPAAVDASAQTGVPPQFMLAQAALETGWGRSEPRRADGSPSFNLFGIKAGATWTGPTVEASTLEVVEGIAQRRTERFRAYGSYEESFADYARLLSGNPRYAAVVGSDDINTFANGLQRAGYATDPLYAKKLTQTASSVSRVLAGS